MIARVARPKTPSWALVSRWGTFYRPGWPGSPGFMPNSGSTGERPFGEECSSLLLFLLNLGNLGNSGSVLYRSRLRRPGSRPGRPGLRLTECEFGHDPVSLGPKKDSSTRTVWPRVTLFLHGRRSKAPLGWKTIG